MKTIHEKPYLELLRRLRQSRKDAGLTQQQLADRLGYPQSFVAKYENAERRLDVLEYLRIAKAIGVDPCDMLRRATEFLESPSPSTGRGNRARVTRRRPRQH